MATNKSSIKMLERISELITQLDQNDDVVKELKLCNKFFKRHIASQKGQKGQYVTDDYEIDLDKGVIRRLRNGKLIREY